jgi:hypothetical protein
MLGSINTDNNCVANYWKHWGAVWWWNCNRTAFLSPNFLLVLMKELDYTKRGVIQPSSQPGFWTNIMTTCGFFAGYHTHILEAWPRPRCMLVFVYPSTILLLSFLYFIFRFAQTVRLLATVINNADTQHNEAIILCLFKVKSKPTLSTDCEKKFTVVKHSILSV